MLAASAGVTGTASAQSDESQISGGQVVVVCPLTVGGEFEDEDPGHHWLGLGWQRPAERRRWGVGSRPADPQDRHWHARPPHRRRTISKSRRGRGSGPATLEDIKIDKLDGKTSFNATLVLHGERRSITGSATLERRDGGYRVQAEFPVSVSQSQHFPKPSYLGVGVQDEIRIKIALTAVPVATTVAAK